MAAKGYRLYLEHCNHSGVGGIELTRAGLFVRFIFDAMLQLTLLPAHRQVRWAQTYLQNNVVCEGPCQPYYAQGRPESGSRHVRRPKKPLWWRWKQNSAGRIGTRPQRSIRGTLQKPGRTGCLNGSGAGCSSRARLRTVDSPHCRYRYLAPDRYLQARRKIGGLFAFMRAGKWPPDVADCRVRGIEFISR